MGSYHIEHFQWISGAAMKWLCPDAEGGQLNHLACGERPNTPVSVLETQDPGH